jgi:hypothetical protein
MYLGDVSFKSMVVRYSSRASVWATPILAYQAPAAVDPETTEEDDTSLPLAKSKVRGGAMTPSLALQSMVDCAENQRGFVHLGFGGKEANVRAPQLGEYYV